MLLFDSLRKLFTVKITPVFLAHTVYRLVMHITMSPSVTFNQMSLTRLTQSTSSDKTGGIKWNLLH